MSEDIQIKASVISDWCRFVRRIFILTGMLFWGLYLFSLGSANYVMKFELHPFGLSVVNEAYYLNEMKEKYEEVKASGKTSK